MLICKPNTIRYIILKQTYRCSHRRKIAASSKDPWDLVRPATRPARRKLWDAAAILLVCGETVGELQVSSVSWCTRCPTTILFSNIFSVGHQTTRPNFQPKKRLLLSLEPSHPDLKPKWQHHLECGPSPMATTWGEVWLKEDVPPHQTLDFLTWSQFLVLFAF